MQQPSIDQCDDQPRGNSNRQHHGQPINTSLMTPVNSSAYPNTQIGDNASVQLGDQYHRNHGVVINAGSVEIGDRALRQLAQLHLQPSSSRKTFGLCLGQAPQIDEEAFIGRPAELQQLQDWFSRDGRAQKVVSIVGMGGLGKTQLSLEYAHKNTDRYTSIFWVNAKDELSLRQSLCKLALIVFAGAADATIKANDEEMQVGSIRRWLSEDWNSQWLMIFDNYDDPNLPNIRSVTGFDIRCYFPHRVQGHVLITTRSTKLTFSKRLSLQKLNDESLWLAVLSQRSGRDLTIDRNAPKLAARLDGLPIALATVGRYLGQANITCAEYLQAYETAWLDLHGPDSEELLEYENRTLSSTWTVSFDQVCKVDADAAELFRFWVYFDNKDMWFELIKASADTGPAWMQRITTNKIRFDRTMGRLQEYSLVECAAGSCSIHPCVHTWISEVFETHPTSFLVAASCLVRSVPKMDSANYWSATQRLLPHINRVNSKIFEVYWAESILSEEAFRFSAVLGYILALWKHGEQAEELYTRALRIYENKLGYTHPWTLDALHELGAFYEIRCRYDKAEEVYSNALKALEQTVELDHWPKLKVSETLAVLRRKQTKPGGVEKRYLRAVEFIGTHRQNSSQGLHLHLENTITESLRVLDRHTDETNKVADWTPPLRSAYALARSLSRSIKSVANSPQVAGNIFARLIRHIRHSNFDASVECGVMYYLARALFWIDDRKNIPVAFSQVTNAGCDGCGQSIESGSGYYVCYQCASKDLCNICMAKYAVDELTVGSCNGHKYCDVGFAVSMSSMPPAKMARAEMDAWLDELEQTYSGINSDQDRKQV